MTLKLEAEEKNFLNTLKIGCNDHQNLLKLTNTAVRLETAVMAELAQREGKALSNKQKPDLSQVQQGQPTIESFLL
jgi:hypothetical protein